MAMSEAIEIRPDQINRRQTRIVGWVLLALAVLVAGIFGAQSTGVATFRLSFPSDIMQIPNLVVPAAPYAYAVAAVLAFFGARQFLRGGAKWSSWVLGIGLFLVVTAFLVWATDGKSFSLTGMLEATVVRAVPIALGGLVGVLCERVAVTNIGIEGMLLAGAFTGAVAGSLWGGVMGIIAAVRRRRAVWASARGAGGHLPRRSDHRRRGDQSIRARTHVLRQQPGADASSRAQQCAACSGRSRFRSSATFRSWGRCCSSRTFSSTAR